MPAQPVTRTRSKAGTSAAPCAKLAVWLFLSFLLLYVGLTRGHFFSTDEIGVFQQTRSLWEHGDLYTAAINDSQQGRDGRYFVPWAVGQSFFAMPLYGLGKGVRVGLEQIGAESWIRAIAGPVVGEAPDKLWSGEVEIFFVNLYNCFVVAAVCSVFLMFNLRLGATPRWALAATIMLGLTTHLAGFSADFFQHPTEALFLLLTLYFLFRDSTAPHWRTRLLAGYSAGVMVCVRPSTFALLPALTAYLLWHAWRRIPDHSQLRERLRECLIEYAPFVAPVAAGFLVDLTVNYWKFESFSFAGGYARLITFNTPLYISLYGFLFSCGESIFLFTPLLVLAPFYFRPFARRYPAETALILAIGISSLLFFGKASTWNGQWYFGPRFLAHLVPPLLLPLGLWLEKLRPAAWLAVVPLALFGLLMEILHVFVNVTSVFFTTRAT